MILPNVGAMVANQMMQQQAMRRQEEDEAFAASELRKSYHESFDQRMELDREALKHFHETLNKGTGHKE